jgi:hypothetical protein
VSDRAEIRVSDWLTMLLLFRRSIQSSR